MSADLSDQIGKGDAGTSLVIDEIRKARWIACEAALEAKRSADKLRSISVGAVLNSGEVVADVATAADVSPKTLYRWISERRYLESEWNAGQGTPNNMSAYGREILECNDLADGIEPE